MYFDEIRDALLELLGQPMAVAVVVVLAGVNAAIWLLVFERVGFPPILAALLLVPPLTFLLPLYVALAQWPSQRWMRIPRRPRIVRAPSPRRAVPAARSTHAVHGGQSQHFPLRLAADGLPLFRIPLPPPTLAPGWPLGQGIDPRYLPQPQVGPYYGP